MLEQLTNSVTFYAFYTASKVGATGLTVTIDVWEVTKAGSPTEIVSAGSATEIGDGLYLYVLASGSVDEEGEYIAVFKTATTTVDQQHIPAIWTIQRAGIENLDTAVSTVDGKVDTIDANVDAILVDTGTDGVVVNSFTTAAKALLQTEANDALVANNLDHLILTTAGSEEPADGTYLDQIMHKAAGQTFDATTDSLEALRDTLSSSTVTVVSAVSGDTVTVVPYVTWEFTLDGLADLTDAAVNGVLFTVKKKHSDLDSAAILQVQEGVGLLVWNGSSTGLTAANASLAVGAGEDEITVLVKASQTAIAEMRSLVYDIKKIITTGTDADQMSTGTFHIADEAVTRKLATA